MRIYTKSGDKGSTFLLSGCRVPKNDPLVISYGKVDTLVSFLGFTKSFLKEFGLKKIGLKEFGLIKQKLGTQEDNQEDNQKNDQGFEIHQILDEIQLLCFKAMTDIASSPSKNNIKKGKNYKNARGSEGKYERISESDISKLESYIDDLWATMPPLKNFVIPGNDINSSTLHICRSICREIEPLLTTANKKYEINPFVLIFINRLSDLLFTLAVKVDYLINQKLLLIKENKKIT